MLVWVGGLGGWVGWVGGWVCMLGTKRADVYAIAAQVKQQRAIEIYFLL